MMLVLSPGVSDYYRKGVEMMKRTLAILLVMTLLAAVSTATAGQATREEIVRLVESYNQALREAEVNATFEVSMDGGDQQFIFVHWYLNVEAGTLCETYSSSRSYRELVYELAYNVYDGFINSYMARNGVTNVHLFFFLTNSNQDDDLVFVAIDDGVVDEYAMGTNLRNYAKE